MASDFRTCYSEGHITFSLLNTGTDSARVSRKETKQSGSSPESFGVLPSSLHRRGSRSNRRRIQERCAKETKHRTSSRRILNQLAPCFACECNDIGPCPAVASSQTREDLPPHYYQIICIRDGNAFPTDVTRSIWDHALGKLHLWLCE